MTCSKPNLEIMCLSLLTGTENIVCKFYDARDMRMHCWSLSHSSLMGAYVCIEHRELDNSEICFGLFLDRIRSFSSKIPLLPTLCLLPN